MQINILRNSIKIFEFLFIDKLKVKVTDQLNVQALEEYFFLQFFVALF